MEKLRILSIPAAVSEAAVRTVQPFSMLWPVGGGDP